MTNGQVGLPNRTVKFTVSRGGTELYWYFALTGANGSVPLGLNGQPGVPSGVLTITASVLGEGGAGARHRDPGPRLDDG